MVAHGRNRNVLTGTVENLTVPGDDLHYGDTVRYHLSGQPNGTFRVEVAAYGNRIDWPQPGTYADKGADRDADPTFVLGISAAGGELSSAEWDDTDNYLVFYWFSKKGGLPVTTVPVLGRRV